MRRRRKWAQLLRQKRASVALEFAFIGPTMFLLVVGVFDISKGEILYQEVFNAAHTIPLSASILAIQPNQTTSLTPPQVQMAMSSIFAEMPWVRNGLASGTRSVTMSSIVFLKNVSSCVPSVSVCAYTPNTVWSVAYSTNNGAGFTNVTRPCGALTQSAASGGVPSNLVNLRTSGVTNPDPIIVVDVHYQYTPVFLSFITGRVDFWASGYWPVRSAPPATPMAQQYTTYDPNNTMNGVGKCPGYS